MLLWRSSISYLYLLNTFYKEYLKHKGIFFLIQANKIEILSYHQSLFYQIKNITLNIITKL